MSIKQLQQYQVPDGMVANCPWGFPLDQWSDRMIERGLTHLDETEGAEFFPNLFNSIGQEAGKRGITL